MLLAPFAEFFKLKPLRRRLFIFRRSVIFSFANRARYRDNFLHFFPDPLHIYIQIFSKDEKLPLPENLEKLKGIFSRTKGNFTTTAEFCQAVFKSSP
jgi:hypothetical protein